MITLTNVFLLAVNDLLLFLQVPASMHTTTTIYFFNLVIIFIIIKAQLYLVKLYLCVFSKQPLKIEKQFLENKSKQAKNS